LRLGLEGGVDEDGLEGDFLEGELLAGLLEKAEGEGIGLVACAELDFSGLADEMRKRLGHLAIEEEGGVGVEFFLELVELALVAVPRPGLIHGEDEQVAALVVGKGVEHSRVGEAHRAGVGG
jgi:hypothetical protein